MGAISGTENGGMHGWWAFQQAWSEVSRFLEFSCFILFYLVRNFFILLRHFSGGEVLAQGYTYGTERLY